MLRSLRSPLMRVPGANPSQEQNCCMVGNADTVGPISEAITNAVSGPMVGMAVRSTPIMRWSEVCSVCFGFCDLPGGFAAQPLSPSSGASGGLSVLSAARICASHAATCAAKKS